VDKDNCLYPIVVNNLKQTMKGTIIVLIFSIFLTSCGGDDYYNLGIYQAKQGNHKKAIEFFTKTIEKNPNDFDAFYNRAVSRQTIGGMENEAISDYTNVIELKPNDFDAFMNRGVANMRIGNYEKAISDYKKTIQINPDYSLTYANLGNVYKILSNNEMACENWKKSLNLGNENVQLRIKLNCE
jgi:tetratricopeptide (TPR) repeat protein